jgi:hypothetical protein
MYRQVLRRTNERVPAVMAAGAYGLSSALLWAFSEGRIPVLVAMAVLPSLLDRLERGFSPHKPGRSLRFIVDAGLVLAIAVSFFPGALLSFAVLALAWLVLPGRKGWLRGIGLLGGTLVAGAALAFPVVLALGGDPGPAAHSTIGRPDFAALLRLSPGPAPGSWSVSWFLPAAALVSLTLVDRGHRRSAFRLAIASIGGVTLAWLSAAGYLPAPVSNPVAYVAAAAVADCALVGLGIAAAVEMGRRAFGYRQLAGIGLAALVAGGLVLQAVEAGIGSWAIGSNKESASWPLVAPVDPGQEYRVLWLGGPSGDPFPPPGGDPVTEASASGQTLRYAVTDPEGATALDFGRRFAGNGYGYLERSLSQVLSGNTTHGGALLGPLGVAYLVAEPGGLPHRVVLLLDAQVDLDLVPTSGLVIYRNERALPIAGVTDQEEYATAAGGTDLLPIASLPPFDGEALDAVPGGFRGSSPGGTALLAGEFADGWRLHADGGQVRPTESFGWGTAFEAAAGDVRITYAKQSARNLMIGVLAILWLAALWITRKPVRR